MLARVTTFTIDGLDPRRVTVEIDVRAGLPNFAIVGLADRAVREARERVRAAILNSGFEFPLKRVTVNLAPASMRKAGPGFDLAIACAILAVGGHIPPDALERYAVFGELGLGGEMRPCRGALAVAEGAARAGLTGLVVPRQRAIEAALVDGLEVVGASSLAQVAEILRGGERPPPPDREESALALARAPSGPRRCPRPHRRRRGADHRRRRGAQPAALGAARRRQDDARPPAALDPAAPLAGGSGRGDAHPQRGGPASQRAG